MGRRMTHHIGAHAPRRRHTRRTRLRGGPGLCAIAICAASANARADTCRPPDIESALPLDGAKNVPLNIVPTAQYPLTAEYDGEEVLLGTDRGALEPVPAFFSENEGILSLSLDQPFMPDTRHTIRWPGLFSVSAPIRGEGLETEFVTGDFDDVENPEFDGIRSVNYDLEREFDDCTDSNVDRFVFTVDLAPASDDGGKESLSIIILQTQGPRVDEPVPVRVAPAPANNRLEVRLPVDDAVGNVCFAALARDLRPDSIPTGGNARACVYVVEPPFFYGCRTARPTNSQPGWALALVAVYYLRRRRVPVPRRD